MATGNVYDKFSAYVCVCIVYCQCLGLRVYLHFYISFWWRINLFIMVTNTPYTDHIWWGETNIVSSLSSSETMCQLNERAQPPCQCLPLQTSEMGDTHAYFIKFVAAILRSEPSELQNLHRNLSAALPQIKIYNLKWTYYGVAGMALSNASPITLWTSGVNGTDCVFM